jgi:hypothetical protein
MRLIEQTSFGRFRLLSYIPPQIPKPLHALAYAYALSLALALASAEPSQFFPALTRSPRRFPLDPAVLAYPAAPDDSR